MIQDGYGDIGYQKNGTVYRMIRRFERDGGGLHEILPKISNPPFPGDLLSALHRLGRHEGHAVSRGL